MDRFLKFYTRCCYFYIYRKRSSALLLKSPSNISATYKILGDFRFLFSEAEKHPVVYRELSLDSRFSRLKTKTMPRPWPWYERSCIKHHRASACHKQNCLTEIYVNSRAWEGRIPEVTWDGVQLRQNLVGSYDDGNDNGQKRNKVRRAKQQLCTCITPFCIFLCRPPTWYDQSFSRLENGNDKAINLSIQARCPLVSSKKTSLNLISLLSGNCFTWYKAENVWKVESRFHSDVPIGVAFVGSWGLYKYQGLPYL